MVNIQGFTAARVRKADRARTPLRVEERELVELAVMIELLATKAGETRLHCEYIVSETRAGPFKLAAVASNDVGPDLRAQAEAKVTAGRFLEFPGDLGGDHRAARKGNGDPGRVVKVGLGQCRCRDGWKRRAASLGE